MVCFTVEEIKFVVFRSNRKRILFFSLESNSSRSSLVDHVPFRLPNSDKSFRQASSLSVWISIVTDEESRVLCPISRLNFTTARVLKLTSCISVVVLFIGMMT